MNAILEKKYNLQIKTSLIKFINVINLNDKHKVIEILQNLHNFVPHKRSEEKNKFIYKFVMKNIKAEFLKNQNYFEIENKRDADFRFFCHFFASDSHDPCKVYKFFFPKNSKNSSYTLNHQFFQVIFSSISFKTKFLDFINTHLEHKYNAIISKKFGNFFYKFERIVKKTSQENAI